MGDARRDAAKDEAETVRGIVRRMKLRNALGEDIKRNMTWERKKRDRRELGKVKMRPRDT